MTGYDATIDVQHQVILIEPQAHSKRASHPSHFTAIQNQQQDLPSRYIDIDFPGYLEGQQRPKPTTQPTGRDRAYNATQNSPIQTTGNAKCSEHHSTTLVLTGAACGHHDKDEDKDQEEKDLLRSP